VEWGRGLGSGKGNVWFGRIGKGRGGWGAGEWFVNARDFLFGEMLRKRSYVSERIRGVGSCDHTEKGSVGKEKWNRVANWKVGVLE
jgi:hypothetical protein